MDLKTLTHKRTENGKIIMTEPTILFKSDTPLIFKYRVDVHTAGRIDLIAIEMYGSASSADYILKYNNISNPFSIEEGDELLIPSDGAPLAVWKNKPLVKAEETNIIRNMFIDTKRLSPKDQKRIEYLKRKAAELPNGVTEILPPNVLKTGKTNITIKNGIISVNGPASK